MQDAFHRGFSRGDDAVAHRHTCGRAEFAVYLCGENAEKEEGMNRVLAISAIAAVASAHSAATPAKWHQARRAAILKAHPEVKDLIGRSSSTLPLLAVTNGLQVASCVAASHLPTPALVPLAILGGGTLSLWQFALLHDIKHGTAELPNGVKANDGVFWGSLPSLFGHY